ncbi:MAG: hypothetical protein J3R72DRAFT_475003 [Linnemannia gamsii]|nr:MAG: hypothetical protein J3R72DRAFT_475003 [Linnemannia gamsii]
MSDPAFLPSSAQIAQQAFRRTTTTTATRYASNRNTRAGGGGRQQARAAAAGGVQSQETVTLPSPNILRHPSTKRPYLFHDIQQQQQQLSGNLMPPPRAPAALGRHVQNLPYNSNGSLTESTVSSNPWLFMPHAPHPRPISNGESVARTPKRTNSASSTSTTSVTYLRNAAAAFIATAHQNHFQFPHKVLHPDIQPLSAHLDLQQRRDFEDDGSAEQDDDSFTSHELRALPRDVRAKAIMTGGVGNGGIHDHDTEQDLLMTDNDDEGQFEDERGQGFESTTPPLDLGQVNNNNTNEEQFGRRPHQYDPILFPSSTATDAVDIDAIASSDAPLFPLLSSYRPSPSTSQLNHIRPYWSRSIEKKADQGLFSSSSSSSVQDQHPSTDRHNHLYQYQHRPQQQQQQCQTFFGRRQENINNNINHKMQGRSASSPLSPPADDNYAAAYQQEVISDDPSSPPPPLYSHPTSFSHVNNRQQYQRPTAAGDDAGEFINSADRRSWVSDMSSEERHLTKQQQLHDHPMSFFSPMLDGNGSGQVIARQDSRSEQDREVFEVCSRRLQHGYTPSQNIHKALVSSIRSSFLASLNGGQRASLMNSDSSGIQQSSPREVSDLQDFQQPWYQPQHLPYHASPDQEYVASSSLRPFEKEEEDERRRREDELLAVIAQLEKDLQELHNSTVELKANLRESEERNERMLIEHDCDLRRVKDEHDYQIQDTKKRTKRFYDETMRKRQRDEDKRLQGLQEQLSQAQTANKELKATIRGLQRERVDVEHGQRDDLAVLCLFIENVLGPLVVGLTSTGRGVGGGGGGGTGVKIAPLQAVESFKRRRPSTITIPAIATIITPGEHDLTPTAAVPHPVPFLAVPTKQDGTPKLTATTTFGSQQQQQQCVSPRGQKFSAFHFLHKGPRRHRHNFNIYDNDASSRL